MEHEIKKALEKILKDKKLTVNGICAEVRKYLSTNEFTDKQIYDFLGKYVPTSNKYYPYLGPKKVWTKVREDFCLRILGDL